MHEGIQRYADEIGIKQPVISYNGAMVRDAFTGDTWLHEEIEPDQAAIVRNFCREHDLQLNYYRDGKVLTAEQTAWLDLYLERTRAPFEVVPRFYEAMEGLASTKLVIINTPEYTDSLKPHFDAIFQNSLYITKTSNEYLEFMPPRANKGAALKLVAERLGVPRGQTIAFGDSFNDIPMLTWAGAGVAVANAKAEVRAVATRQTLSNEEDGVAVALSEIYRL